MSKDKPGRFDLQALFGALDAQRRARGLTWAAAVRDMSGPFAGGGSRRLAVSTVTRLRTQPVAEGDGVLQMLGWLGGTPESFVPGCPVEAVPLPAVAPDSTRRVLRMDTRKLHAAVDAARVSRGLTWDEAAREIGRWSAGSLAHLSKGGRTGFPHVMRITAWLGRPLADFVRLTSR
ncbi:MAG TPA: hypothetical protein VEU08_22575 [Vicinamibacterales bacterium]|nr:hypothetical protein [Vicinamibacterales bacterium]